MKRRKVCWPEKRQKFVKVRHALGSSPADPLVSTRERSHRHHVHCHVHSPSLQPARLRAYSCVYAWLCTAAANSASLGVTDTLHALVRIRKHTHLHVSSHTYTSPHTLTRLLASPVEDARRGLRDGHPRSWSPCLREYPPYQFSRAYPHVISNESSLPLLGHQASRG